MLILILGEIMAYTNGNKYATPAANPDPAPAVLSATYTSSKTDAQLASLKTLIETSFAGVSFSYVEQANGSFLVTVAGPKQKHIAAMRYLFPKTHPWVRQPSQWGDDPDHYTP